MRRWTSSSAARRRSARWTRWTAIAFSSGSASRRPSSRPGWAAGSVATSWRPRSPRPAGWGRSPSTAPPRSSASWPRRGAHRPAARGQRPAAVRPARLVRGRGRRPTSSSPSGARPKRRSAGRLAPPVRLGRRGARGARRRRRRSDRPGRRGRRARARRRCRRSSCSSGCRRRAAGRLSRCCSPAGSPSAPTWTRALEAGASAAVAGTRFLLSEESRAHPEYRSPAARRRGDGPHRALRRRLAGATPRRSPMRRPSVGLPETHGGRLLNRALNRLSGSGARYMPASIQGRIVRAQQPTSRLLSPQGPTDDGPTNLLDAGPPLCGRDRGTHRRRASRSRDRPRPDALARSGRDGDVLQRELAVRLLGSPSG